MAATKPGADEECETAGHSTIKEFGGLEYEIRV